MGRNAAFGRPPAFDRIRMWWEARESASRTNVLLGVGFGALVVGILVAAVSRDTSPATPAAKVIRPPMQTIVPGPPSTVFIEGLNAPGATSTTTEASTTTTSVRPATTTATSPPRTSAPAVATTSAPAPATTVTNPDVIFTEVTTTAPRPTTTPPPTTLPPTTLAPTTTTTPPSGLNLPPLDLPRLLEP